jgi:HSP20 family protein
MFRTIFIPSVPLATKKWEKTIENFSAQPISALTAEDCQVKHWIRRLIMRTRRDLYYPLSMLPAWSKEMDQLFNSMRADDEETNVATSSWMPAVDIAEEGERFVLRADIPGVDPKDIEITMENGVLTIKGERILMNKEEERNFKRIERVHGSFYRRFSLPDTADAEHISANGKNGVLEIVIPKRPLAQPRRISVE